VKCIQINTCLTETAEEQKRRKLWRNKQNDRWVKISRTVKHPWIFTVKNHTTSELDEK
jgi:hypothetical protein